MRSGLTLEDLRELTTTLAVEVTQKIIDFEELTGCRVNGMDVHRQRPGGMGTPEVPVIAPDISIPVDVGDVAEDLFYPE